MKIIFIQIENSLVIELLAVFAYYYLFLTRRNELSITQ